MKNLIKIFSLTLVIVLVSFNSLNEKKPLFISCEESFHINSITLNLCNNSGQFLTEEQIISGLGSSFSKSFSRIEESSFEDTGGKAYYYEFSENGNTNKTVFITIFLYPNGKYYYSFSIDSDKAIINYNSGVEIKIGDPLSKVSNEFQSKGFKYNSIKKSATINIIDEGYLTFYFDDEDKLKSISYNNQLI